MNDNRHYDETKFTKEAAEREMQAIESLREQAREMRKYTEELVKEIGDNDPEEEGLTTEEKAKIALRRESLLTEWAEKNYETKLPKLIQDIHDKEVALFGESDVGHSSIPYVL